MVGDIARYCRFWPLFSYFNQFLCAMLLIWVHNLITIDWPPRQVHNINHQFSGNCIKTDDNKKSIRNQLFNTQKDKPRFSFLSIGR